MAISYSFYVRYEYELQQKLTESNNKYMWINKRRLKHIKAFQIQRHWRNCSCNPEYKLAQRMLSRVYES